MGHRLSRITTRTGDRGQTGLASGARVPKDALPIEVLGAVDELNSCIGVVITYAQLANVRTALECAQHDLFDLGAQVSAPGTPLLSAAHVHRIDTQIEAMSAGLGMLKEFILPGGAPASAFAHIARTVCRRTERRLFTLCDAWQDVAVTQGEEQDNYGLCYLNRLSDLLFIISRLENQTAGGADILWQRGKSVVAG